ncbi:MAG: GNAT family N-acetyltransferase [Anaerolineae bacterium]
MTPQDQVMVRPMRPDEAAAVKAIARRAFPLQQMLFFSLTDHVLVAESQGNLAGGVVLETFPIRGGRRGGIVLWFFVDPAAQGQGAGQALVDAALTFFEAQGCTDVFACVEGYNTNSARRWAHRGMGILSPGAQLRRYGLALLPVWLHTFHFLDVGHFLWARPSAERPDKPWLQWWGVALMNTLLLTVALWAQNGYRMPALGTVGLCGLAALLFLGVRSLAMVAAARAQGLRLRFRAWESGFPLGVVIAGVLGGYYANPGGFYPPDDDWRYRDLLPKLGPTALAGVATTLALLLALRLWGPVEGPLEAWRNVATWVGTSLGVVDILVPFFPLGSYNGRRIWDWRPWVWALAALGMVALLAL